MDDYKNSLPGEVEDHPDSGVLRQLRTQADSERPLTRHEADVAGITDTPETEYGEGSLNPNAEDQRDAHKA
jgi:hypothetical protein